VTAVDGRDKLVRSLINGNNVHELPPQFTQKAFQKPQTVLGGQVGEQGQQNYNPYSSPQKNQQEQGNKQKLMQSPIYSAEIANGHIQPQQHPQQISPQMASFKKPTVIRSVTEQSAPMQPHQIHQITHPPHPKPPTVNPLPQKPTNLNLPANGHPFSRGPSSNRILPIPKSLNVPPSTIHQ
jgi:hypothetical protein